MRDAIVRSQPHYCTYLGAAINSIYGTGNIETRTSWGFSNSRGRISGYNLRPDRLIVLTDEQSHDKVPDPVVGKGYIINVASYQNGVGYGPWTHIDGFSESITDYVLAYEDFERNLR